MYLPDAGQLPLEAPDAPAARGGDQAAERGARPGAGELAAELERWLCPPTAPVPSTESMAAAFGIAPELLASLFPRTSVAPLRFALAVLRDVFPSDAEVRRWFHAPVAAGSERPFDLLLRGELERVAALAVRAWQRAGGGASLTADGPARSGLAPTTYAGTCPLDACQRIA